MVASDSINGVHFDVKLLFFLKTLDAALTQKQFPDVLMTHYINIFCPKFLQCLEEISAALKPLPKNKDVV